MYDDKARRFSLIEISTIRLVRVSLHGNSQVIWLASIMVLHMRQTSTSGTNHPSCRNTACRERLSSSNDCSYSYVSFIGSPMGVLEVIIIGCACRLGCSIGSDVMSAQPLR